MAVGCGWDPPTREFSHADGSCSPLWVRCAGWCGSRGGYPPPTPLLVLPGGSSRDCPTRDPARCRGDTGASLVGASTSRGTVLRGTVIFILRKLAPRDPLGGARASVHGARWELLAVAGRLDGSSGGWNGGVVWYVEEELPHRPGTFGTGRIPSSLQQSGSHLRSPRPYWLVTVALQSACAEYPVAVQLAWWSPTPFVAKYQLRQ